MNRNTLFTVLFLCLSALRSFSQSDIQLQPLDIRNTIMLEDLWNLNITLLKPTNFQSFYLTMEVATTPGSPLVRGETAPFRLQQGTLNISPLNIDILQPQKVYYLSSDFYSRTLENGGYFPSGTYHVRYVLYGTANDPVAGTVTERMASAELLKTVETLYPPMLLTPFNGETLDNIQSVVFTWTPAMGYQSVSVNYTIRIAEIWDGISPVEALSSTSLFYRADGLNETFFTYPPEAAGFAEDRLYAWQVTAFFDNNSSVNSEYFVFTYHPSRPEPNYETNSIRIKSRQFAAVKSIIDGGFCIVFDTLRFCYEEPYSTDSSDYLHFVIFNKTNDTVLLPVQDDITTIASIPGPLVNSGTNCIALPVNLANLPKNEYYFLIITNVRKEQRFLRFFIAGDNIPFVQSDN